MKQVLLDANNVVVQIIDASSAQPGAGLITISDDVYAQMEAATGRIQFIDGVVVSDPLPPDLPLPQSVLSQDIMAQFTAADATLIQAAVNSNVQFWLLWSAFQAQSDPMIVTNARFQTGWAALITVLGSARMAAIATALGITVQ